MTNDEIRLRSVRAGYTLVEITISTFVCCVAFLAMATAWITLQKSYFAVDGHSESVADQLRALDYISRDARSAISTAAGASTLTLTLPDYYFSYDAQGNPTGAPVSPSIVGSTVSYNVSTQPVTVVYSVSNGALSRQVTISRTGAPPATTLVCSGVSNFTSNFTAQTSSLVVSLSFADTFRGVQSSANPGTTVTANIYLRNLQH
jgi:Tfp pilus assembly protein PilW